MLDIYDLYLEYEKLSTLIRSNTRRINFSIKEDKLQLWVDSVNTINYLKCVKNPGNIVISGDLKFHIGYISFPHNVNPNQVFEILNTLTKELNISVLSSK